VQKNHARVHGYKGNGVFFYYFSSRRGCGSVGTGCLRCGRDQGRGGGIIQIGIHGLDGAFSEACTCTCTVEIIYSRLLQQRPEFNQMIWERLSQGGFLGQHDIHLDRSRQVRS
jgi:hypothetical protein